MLVVSFIFIPEHVVTKDCAFWLDGRLPKDVGTQCPTVLPVVTPTVINDAARSMTGGSFGVSGMTEGGQ